MTTAFVLSGGASLGAVQAGMYLALEAEGIKPDMVFGTSVGAINGAWIAAEKSADGLAAVWLKLRRNDLFAFRPLVGLRGFSGRASHLVSNRGLTRLLAEHIPFDRLEQAPVPLTVVATDAQSGAEIVLDCGPARPAVLASAALPGIFPPVSIDGRMLIDGGVVNNTPITRAVEAGASEVWVLSTGYSCALPRPPSGALAMALHSVALLVQQRLAIETTHRTYSVPVHLIPPPCPVSVTPVDFSQSRELIERARKGTTQWIRNGKPFAIPITHTH